MTRLAVRTGIVAVLAATLAACSSDSPTSPVKTLEITDIQVGTGAEATAGKTVTVDYTGWIYSETAPNHKGTQFASSQQDGEPLVFAVGVGVAIPGFDQGVLGMKVGGTRTITIPPNLAYGKVGSGPIPPNSALIFDVALLNVQ